MTEKQKEIINELYKFKSGINLYQVFDDWVELMAYAFSNAINFMQSREDVYTDSWNYPVGAFHGADGGSC